MKNESFVLFTKIIEVTRALTDEQKGRLFQAILDYQESGEVPEMDTLTRIAFLPIKHDMDICTENREKVLEQKREAGRASAERRSAKGNTVEQRSTPSNDNVNVNVNDIDKETSSNEDAKKVPQKRFVKPTLEEVAAYCLEKGYSVDAEAFISYYDSNGWRVGRNPMRDWKAATRNWHQREKERPSGRSPTKVNFDQRQDDLPTGPSDELLKKLGVTGG